MGCFFFLKKLLPVTGEARHGQTDRREQRVSCLHHHAWGTGVCASQQQSPVSSWKLNAVPATAAAAYGQASCTGSCK
jgi:hypothetical protein